MSSFSSKYGDIVFRPPRISEAADIFRIHLKSLSGLDEEDYEWFYNFLRVKSNRRVIIVAEKNNKIIGFLIAYKYYNKVYVDSLAVEPEYRGMGIGTKMLETFEQGIKGKRRKTIYLSVKKDNFSALGFYIRNGYQLDGLVLELVASTDKIRSNSINGYVFLMGDAGRINIDKKMLSTTWWSNITEPVDKLVYHRLDSEKIILSYKNGKLRGILEFQPDKEIVIDYLGVSYHRPVEALKSITAYLKQIAKDTGINSVMISIDSGKTRMIKALLEIGFRIVGGEYRLKKTI